jgi:hypothetical protein
MKRPLLLLLIICALSLKINAQILVSTHGSPHFNTSSLFVTEAGNDFNNVIYEDLPETFIDVTQLNKNNREYEVYASLAGMQGTMILEVKRVTDGYIPSGGSAIGRISGGLNYIRLSTTPVLFFTGRGDRLNVKLGFSLKNLSVVQPAGNVTFSLILTAIEI